jgi:hypothetical protein
VVAVVGLLLLVQMAHRVREAMGAMVRPLAFLGRQCITLVVVAVGHGTLQVPLALVDWVAEETVVSQTLGL